MKHFKQLSTAGSNLLPAVHFLRTYEYKETIVKKELQVMMNRVYNPH